MNKKKINALIVFIIGILVSAFSIALVIRKVEFSKLIETAAGVSGAGFFLLTLSLILTFFTYLIRALFWNLIIRFGAGYKLSYKNSLSVLSIGLLGNNILPAKSGEIIRAVVLSKKTNLKKSFIFGSIFLERFFDLIVLLFFLFLSSLIIKFPENIKKIEIVSFIIIGAIIFFLLIFFLFYQKILSHKVFKFSKFLSKFCAWLLEKINSFKKPIVEILNLKRAVISFLLSLTIWISSTISLYLVGRTLNIQLSLIFYFLIIAVINLGAII
ncbi:MAG TPA: lysylphosphatidylglycerol synthase transmembrane domain-containing protein, partial [Spirochaetota bacterium]|nr:lysylphosphatidylglycerol synthase transmembrane domain-containing protein [Spirochaetota bacterium]